MNYAGRLQRLGSVVEQHGYAALLITNLVNVRYLTGYTGTNGAVIVRPQDAVFLTDFRYLERVKPLREFLEVREVKREILQPAAEALAEMIGPQGGAGFEGAHVSHADFAVLARTVDANRLVSVLGAVESLRIVKDEEELELVRRAAALTEPIYAGLADEGLTGRSERDIAWRVRELAHEAGAEDIAFPTIVASGSAGAQPHAEPRDTPIERNQLVTIDLGCILEGYRSDCTRTFSTGLIPEPLSQAYQVCLAAQLAGLSAVRPGVTGHEADDAVRRLVTDAGLGERFRHGLGHGVGLDIHEDPRLAPGKETVLEPGMVVTVEPGIYLPGLGGVRIEDLVIVTADGCERLTEYPKDLITTT